MNIQWYPGHMTKTKRQIMKDISLISVVLELLDARIPYSSRNPDIAELTRGKKRIVILNKADLASEKVNAEWRKHYEAQGIPVICANSANNKGRGDIPALAEELMRDKIDRNSQRGRVGTTTRAIVLGIPNVGKSTLINKYAGRSAAVAADRPGVTRGRQWIKVSDRFELLDTPGILWPKLDDQDVGVKLAVTGAIKERILDMTDLACAFIAMLSTAEASAIPGRYGVTPTAEEAPAETLERIGAARGFKLKGGVIDLERAAITLLDEYRGGLLGRITLEKPGEHAD